MKKNLIHPGIFIKETVINPKRVSITQAAKLLQVSRPSLSNLLNGNADLSKKMAMLIEKTFEINAKELLQMQSDYDHSIVHLEKHEFEVLNYVPHFRTIKAIQIANWASNELEARSLLPVLLRKLIHSTARGLTYIDIPGYDNAQKRGWDGDTHTSDSTPWVPSGTICWEFGCSVQPKVKAQTDYSKRTKETPAVLRKEITLIFVSPQTWDGKRKWIEEKTEMKEWKAVRAYDANDLEQWVEQSIPSQNWFADKLGLSDIGAHSLEKDWDLWSKATTPALSKDIFASLVEKHSAFISTWLTNEPSSPLILSAESKEEALAFINALFLSENYLNKGWSDKSIVFTKSEALQTLASSTADFIVIASNNEVEKAMGDIAKKKHTIILRPKSKLKEGNFVELDILSPSAFERALQGQKFERETIEQLAKESGRSLTVLRRRLTDIPGIQTPQWIQNSDWVRQMIPLIFAGNWDTTFNADLEIISVLSNSTSAEIEKTVAALIQIEDSPLWAIGHTRGLVSKLDSFFAVHNLIVQNDLKLFFDCAKLVLSESDPSLELPSDQRWAAGIYGKIRNHSSILRKSICETLVLLAVHGNGLFKDRLGINIQGEVDNLVRDLLLPLTNKTYLTHQKDFPFYAEAAPYAFLRLIKDDLDSENPQILSLLTPVAGHFGICDRTGLLWALEVLAWEPFHLLDVTLMLAKLCETKIEDNWVNKPINTLQSLFRSWMPQTKASLDQRIQALKKIYNKYPLIGWEICISQFKVRSDSGFYNYKPIWRKDSSILGQPVSAVEKQAFVNVAIGLCFQKEEHTTSSLSDLIERLQGLSIIYQERLWYLIIKWGKENNNELEKASLKEHINKNRFFSKNKSKFQTHLIDLSNKAIAALEPSDVNLKHAWLFRTQWLDYTFQELEDVGEINMDVRSKKIEKLRIEAIAEIYSEKGFRGILSILPSSEAEFMVGALFAIFMKDIQVIILFIQFIIEGQDLEFSKKTDTLLNGLLHNVSDEDREQIFESFFTASLNIERLFFLSPFKRHTWDQLVKYNEADKQEYWQKVSPNFWQHSSMDLRFLVDKLLEVHRPSTAFQAIKYDLEQIDSLYIIKILNDIPLRKITDNENYRFSSYEIIKALKILGERQDVTGQELANLEFTYLKMLEYEDYGIPNLQKEVAKSPELFIDILSMVYKRKDGKEDDVKLKITNEENRKHLFSLAYSLLNILSLLPGTQEDGIVNGDQLNYWVHEVRKLACDHGRQDAADTAIGQLLSHSPIGLDENWPCESVRDILEEISSKSMATGFDMGKYNSRGAHFQAPGGEEELALAKQYRIWANSMAYEHPFVSQILISMGEGYQHQAQKEISDERIRNRITFN